MLILLLWMIICLSIILPFQRCVKFEYHFISYLAINNKQDKHKITLPGVVSEILKWWRRCFSATLAISWEWNETYHLSKQNDLTGLSHENVCTRCSFFNLPRDRWLCAANSLLFPPLRLFHLYRCYRSHHCCHHHHQLTLPMLRPHRYLSKTAIQ